MQKELYETKQAAESKAVGCPDISVVIVCLNNKKYLQPCLESLWAAGARSSFEVVVVDNGSTDGSQQMLMECFPEVSLLRNNRNVGLSRASNQGMAAAKGRYLLLLNDDTVVNGRSLDSMVEFLDRHPEAAGAGGRLLNGDGSFQAGYTRFPTLLDEFRIATGWSRLQSNGESSGAYEREPRAVDWVGSACLLLRREALDEVGLLDEEYFIYGDEVDLQYRLKQRGWLVYYLPDVYTIHFGGRSMDRWRRRRMVYRGKMLFYRKNYGPWRTGALRFMLGALTLAKISVWAAALAVPGWRCRAQRELQSNLDVVRLCARLA
jgi:O-antigen biosynthesis protein